MSNSPPPPPAKISEISTSTEVAAPGVPLADLFLSDPLELEDKDIMRIVSYFRDRRQAFSVEAAKGNRAPTTKRLLEPAKKIDLGDLDL